MYMRSSAEMARSSVNSAATCALTSSRNLAIVVPFLHCTHTTGREAFVGLAAACQLATTKGVGRVVGQLSPGRRRRTFKTRRWPEPSQ
jgi:hypothetical protein